MERETTLSAMVLVKAAPVPTAHRESLLALVDLDDSCCLLMVDSPKGASEVMRLGLLLTGPIRGVVSAPIG